MLEQFELNLQCGPGFRIVWRMPSIFHFSSGICNGIEEDVFTEIHVVNAFFPTITATMLNLKVNIT